MHGFYRPALREIESNQIYVSFSLCVGNTFFGGTLMPRK